MSFLRTLVVALTLFSALVSSSALGAEEPSKSILFIATSNVPTGKFRLLNEIAAPLGLKVEVRYVDKLPADTDAGLFTPYAAVFIDSYLQDYVKGRLSKALPGLKLPWVWLYQAQASFGQFPEETAKRLLTHYAQGGRKNFEAFFKVLQAHLQHRHFAGIPAPIIYPTQGIYHPLANGEIFSSVDSFKNWRVRQGQSVSARGSVVAILIHQQYLSSEQTSWFDDLVQRIEARGAIAMPVYAAATESVIPFLSRDGKSLVDLIINTQIMLAPELRKIDFAGLGVPVLQATAYRRGDSKEWRADQQGLALADVPFYLAQSEYTGISDIMIIAAHDKSADQIVAIPEQSQALADKALRMLALQQKPHAEKRLGLMFWNYPPGEKNLSASYLNLPRSLVQTLEVLRKDGYQTSVHDETTLTSNLQRLLAPSYRDGELPGLLRDDLAELFPVASYRSWLQQQTKEVQDALNQRWGDPERSAMTIQKGGQSYFVVPRFKLGNLVMLPQAPRGEKWEEKEKALYHHPKALPSHFYLASYLWLRQQFKADALIHYGTHGSQEWLPGKERGLSVYDYPLLALGDLPVIYPYIVDNIGEALQAKRRGRAVTITHQTPAFTPAGLHNSLIEIHDLLHAWLAQDLGAVKDKIAQDLIKHVKAQKIDKDLAWSDDKIAHDFQGFVTVVHDHLHELAQTAQPLGLHTFGVAPQHTHRIGTVLLMLGRGYWEAVGRWAKVKDDDLDEVMVGDYRQLQKNLAYRMMDDYILEQKMPENLPIALQDKLKLAHSWYQSLAAQQEQTSLLHALDGRYIPSSYGGDPIKNPDALPTGRNLYGFDPSRIPTQQAWAAGKEALDKLLLAHQQKHGSSPRKLTFSLWSVETMRHQGILEAQALWALGVEPVWDAGGRVTGVRLIPREQLGRPRVDVVLSVTGLYRDQFPNTMQQLAKAVQIAAQAKETDNAVAQNSLKMAAKLREAGIPEDQINNAAQTRIFSSESGRYGTGLDDATLASDSWKSKEDGDKKLAQLYLSRMQFAYGADQSQWGNKLDAVNLYAEALRGTDAAVLSRSSNLYGMLTTDDPFQYLGGISLAVRHLDGKPPELYISNLREAGQNGSGKVESAAGFLAKELATRNFHPGYIKGLMAEGYAGTLQIVDSMNNFWGWQAVAREVVRDDQWQEFVDVYVKDKHQLGLRKWFQENNPHALAQTIERMLEAARKDYWKADAATVAELKREYLALAKQHDVTTDNAAFSEFIGLGQQALPSAPAKPSPASRSNSKADANDRAKPPAKQPSPSVKVASPQAVPVVKGIQLQKLSTLPNTTPSNPWHQSGLWGLIAMLLAFMSGVFLQLRLKKSA